MIVTIPISIMRPSMKRASLSVLNRTVSNSQARIAKGNLTPAAEQTEINRIQAAIDEIASRQVAKPGTASPSAEAGQLIASGMGSKLIILAGLAALYVALK